MINIKHSYWLHQGGTKDYDLYHVYSDDTHTSLLIKRWGKVGAPGQVMKEIIDSDKGIRKMRMEEDKRRKKGYRERGVHSKSKDDLTFQDVLDTLGSHVAEKMMTHLQTVFLSEIDDEKAVSAEELREKMVPAPSTADTVEEWGTW